jgi:hypothetical protein
MIWRAAVRTISPPSVFIHTKTGSWLPAVSGLLGSYTGQRHWERIGAAVDVKKQIGISAAGLSRRERDRSYAACASR